MVALRCIKTNINETTIARNSRRNVTATILGDSQSTVATAAQRLAIKQNETHKTTNQDCRNETSTRLPRSCVFKKVNVVATLPRHNHAAKENDTSCDQAFTTQRTATTCTNRILSRKERPPTAPTPAERSTRTSLSRKAPVKDTNSSHAHARAVALGMSRIGDEFHVIRGRSWSAHT